MYDDVFPHSPSVGSSSISETDKGILSHQSIFWPSVAKP